MVLRRKRHEMPDFIDEALVKNNLYDAYLHRPAHQQNDYIGWIARARREETQQKRLNQMLAELKAGDKYMKMRWRAKH